MESLSKYQEMQKAGSTPVEIYAVMKSDGLHLIESIRVLRLLFGLELAAAKDVTCRVDSGMSLDERQGLLVEPLKQAFAEMDREDPLWDKSKLTD